MGMVEENLEMVEEEETIVSRRMEEEGKVEMEEVVRKEEVMEKDFKEEMEEDLKEEMEEDFKEEMVVEDQETVEDKEAMDPKIANILNVNKPILREELEEVWLEETIKGAEGPNVNRIMMVKITATSSQIVFGTINETKFLWYYFAFVL